MEGRKGKKEKHRKKKSIIFEGGKNKEVEEKKRGNARENGEGV